MQDDTSPKQNFTCLSIGQTNLDSLFDKIAKGLEKYNQREEEKKLQHHKKGGRKRFSDQFAPLRKTAAHAANAKKLPSCLGTSPSVVGASSLRADDRPAVLFDLKSKTTKPSSSYGSYYRLPPGSVLSSSYDSSPCRLRLPNVKKPAPAAMKFDPPSFTFCKSTNSFSAESSSQSVLAGKVPCDDDKGDQQPKEETSAIIEDSDAPHSGSDEQTEGLANSSSQVDGDPPSITSPRDQADGASSSSTTKRPWKKRDANMFDIDSSQDFTYGYGYNPFPPPINQQFGEKKWSKEDVDGLVAFADKWIPHPKKRRMDEEK